MASMGDTGDIDLRSSCPRLLQGYPDPLCHCDESSSFVMPALVAGIHGLHACHMKAGWVYIMTNRPNGVLYVGVTSDLVQRVWQHREGVVEGFTRRYGLKRLVYFEQHEEIAAAIQREKTIKHWSRAWKVNLIVKKNVHWDDLYESLTS